MSGLSSGILWLQIVGRITHSQEQHRVRVQWNRSIPHGQTVVLLRITHESVVLQRKLDRGALLILLALLDTVEDLKSRVATQP